MQSASHLSHMTSLTIDPSKPNKPSLLIKPNLTAKYVSLQHSPRMPSQNQYRYRNSTEQRRLNKRSSVVDILVPQLKNRERGNPGNSPPLHKNATLNSKLEAGEMQERQRQIRREFLGKEIKTPVYFAPITLKSNARINSLKEQNRTGKVLLPIKAEVKEQDSTTSLPKYLAFCNEFPHANTIDEVSQATQISRKDPQPLNPQYNLMNKYLNEDKMPERIPAAKAKKVQGMKEGYVSPSLVPVTTKNDEISAQISIEWVRHEYRPHLQMLERSIAELKLALKRYNEGVYVGQMNEQSQWREGLGIIFYNSGKIFEGVFQKDKKEGSGFQKYSDGSFYLGAFHLNRRDGHGKFQWSNGEIYDGEWKAGRKQGSGVWRGPEGVSYVGQWQQDVIQGFGVLIDKEERYEGSFRNFQKWGHGTYRFKNGETYVGQFVRNLPNGKGEYRWANGDVYKGDFLNGQRHGKGVLESAEGSYRGDFLNDKKCGYGEEAYLENLFYVGNFENDLRHGWGILYCDHYVRVFEGYWLNNQALKGNGNQFETIIEEDQSNDYPDLQPLPKPDNRLSRQRLIAKKQQQSRLAFKVFKEKNASREKNVSLEKSLNKEKNASRDISSESHHFRRNCQCERHRTRN